MPDTRPLPDRKFLDAMESLTDDAGRHYMGIAIVAREMGYKNLRLVDSIARRMHERGRINRIGRRDEFDASASYCLMKDVFA